MNLPRDVFIQRVFNYAKKDRDILFLSADLGALTLDTFRRELGDQFFHMGISEQNMIDTAAGLAQCGKKVFVYAMSSFVTLRCLEQIKVSLVTMNLPVTIVGVGAGFSYEDAGPTHYSLEDIACMRSLGCVEIYSPSDNPSVEYCANICLERPSLRYIRLDRSFIADIHCSKSDFEAGIIEVVIGQKICVITTGAIITEALKSIKKFSNEGINIGLINCLRLDRLNVDVAKKILSKYNYLITFEEHFLNGGLGSIILEFLADYNLDKKVIRMGVNNKYPFRNGGRDYLRKTSHIHSQHLNAQIKKLQDK